MRLPARQVVYVVAKAPRSGEAKTRLCPPLAFAQAARLAETFLLDTLHVVRQAALVPRVVCRDTAEQADLARLVDRSVQLWAQAGVGLGDALEGAFHAGLADGFDAVAVLGADTPTLPPSVLRAAFGALERDADVALGPSEDGGYYLLAARAVHPGLFRDMRWSTSRVAAETLARCARLRLRVHHLPTWYDVDDAPSLERLRVALDHLPPAAARHTRAALAELEPSAVHMRQPVPA